MSYLNTRTACQLTLAIACAWMPMPPVALAQQAGVTSPPATNSAATAVPGTPRQQAWLNASASERKVLAEQLGEEGARAYAKSKGWQPLMDGTAKSIPQGPDQIYRASDGMVHVIEAKGGSSYLGHAYGHPQGSPEWAVESANRLLRSAKATTAERAAAKAVLDAAANGTLEVHVIRVSHQLGEPTAAVVKQSLKSTEKATALARTALEDFGKVAAGAEKSAATSVGKAADGLAESAKSAAGATGTTGSKVLRGAGKVMLVAGAAADVGLRANDAVQVERRYDRGEISQHERVVEHAGNAGGLVGGWTGAYAGAETFAMAGAAIGAPFGGIGAPIGAAIGGIAGGIGGYFFGDWAGTNAGKAAANAMHQ